MTHSSPYILPNVVYARTMLKVIVIAIVVDCLMCEPRIWSFTVMEPMGKLPGGSRHCSSYLTTDQLI